MISRTYDVLPKMLADELLRLGKLDPDWIQWVGKPNDTYDVACRQETWTRKLWKSGADAFSMWAGSIWLANGPKIFRPTVQQCEALEQIEVRLELGEYAQPYPAILIDLPDGKYDPFIGILCHKAEHILTCSIFSKDHKDDITTTVAVDGRPIELSLQKFDDNLTALGGTANHALRVAVNSCLALVNFGCYAKYLFDKQADIDKKLSNEQSERGKKARERLKTSLKLVSFNQEVVLHRHDNKGHGEPTGREVSCHWRRGHWRMQKHGPGLSQSKRILILPVMVRADKLTVDVSETSTVYKG